MKVSFEHDLAHNYVIPELENEEKNNHSQETEYELHMLEENHIPGFMECSRRKINGKNRYYYEITSRQSLAQICETESLTAVHIRKLLRCLYEALQQMDPYLLDGNKIVLQPELIYLDIESREASFCYWPLWGQKMQDSFRIFAAYLLYHLEQSDTEAVLLMYEISRKVQEKNYALLELLQEKIQPLSDIMTSSQTEKTTQPEEEKKLQMNDGQQGALTEHIAVQPKIQKIIKEKVHIPGMCEKKKTSKNRKRKESSLAVGVIFLVVLGIVGIAAWMGLLTITQAGGIAFLLIGAMAYVLSPEKKQKRKKEKEKKEQDEVPEIKWEMPEPIPTAAEIEHEKEEQVGATTVLREGTEEYQPHLTLISMNARERNSVVLVKDSYLVGKLKSKVDIYIDDASISRMHAKIQKENEEYYLCDLNSTNGTFLNGKRLGIQEKVPIHVADEITFASLGYYVGNC